MKIPSIYLEKFFYARRRLVEIMLSGKTPDEMEVEIIKASHLLSPMVATCGPAGPNVAPLMVTFLPREQYVGEAIEELRRIRSKYWGSGPKAYRAAAEFLLEYVYNLERADPLRLATHLMSKGHTYTNIEATGEATLGILFPPDEGALELRAKASIISQGPVYEYVNMVHDLMHAVPHGESSHPWYPAAVFEVYEIYDNSYQALGKLVYRRG
ncbi:MAG: hypothetical protein F7C35_07695 [Desulfurococcales archaeon]|nr:hypothetical protein [Desulfurococcales archaeon]